MGFIVQIRTLDSAVTNDGVTGVNQDCSKHTRYELWADYRMSLPQMPNPAVLLRPQDVGEISAGEYVKSLHSTKHYAHVTFYHLSSLEI